MFVQTLTHLGEHLKPMGWIHPRGKMKDRAAQCFIFLGLVGEQVEQFAGLLSGIEDGQSLLTRRGKHVAVVVSLREIARLRSKPARFGETYKRFLKTHPLREIGLEQDFFDSARDRDTGRKVVL